MSTTSTGDNAAPYSVAIVAMGPSHAEYIQECVRCAGRQGVADETWAINAMAGIIEHDRAIIMDALPYFEKAGREENTYLRGYAPWLSKHRGPIYTQQVYPDFPGSVAYPLEDVLNTVKYAYSNTTVSYAILLAIHMQVKHIKLYGCDFTSDNNKGFSEAGRACVEYWLSDATWRGIKVTIAATSTLMDQCIGRRLYGYSKPPVITHAEGKFKVEAP